MKTHNIVGTSKGYVERVVSSYNTVNQKMAEMRKSHRGAAVFETDHSLKAYNRNRY